MMVTPNFHFRGSCKEAIALYKKALNLKISHILYYEDANPSDWDIHTLTEAEKSYVYHSEGYLGTQRIMMADEINAADNSTASLFLILTFDTASEVEQAFNILAETGTVIYPLHTTTYSSLTGSVLDKFGFRWGLMTEQTER